MKPLHTFIGNVIEGNKRGRVLGYPTANMSIAEAIEEGVYAATITIDKQRYTAATFIGRSKTFDDYEYKLESYILDFDQDIYGKKIQVDVYKQIRGNMKFENKEALIDQMKKDVADIRNYFRSPE